MQDVSLDDFTVTPDFDVDMVDAVLSRYGAAVVPNWVNDELLKRLQKDWESVRLERNDKFSKRISRLGGSVADYAGLYRSAPNGKFFSAIEEVFNSSKMIEVCDRYIGRPYLLNEEIYATYDVGIGEEVARSHFDKTFNIKFFIYLHDILESGQGALSIHPGSQKLARFQFRDWFSKNCNGDRVEIGTESFYEMGNETLPKDLGPCVEIFGRAGTLIIFNTDVFHRGGLLERGLERRVIRGHCYPGYQLPRGGDFIRRDSRQWIRGENWEVHRAKYSRFSVDGFIEYFEFFSPKLKKILYPVFVKTCTFKMMNLVKNPALLMDLNLYKKIIIKFFR